MNLYPMSSVLGVLEFGNIMHANRKFNDENRTELADEEVEEEDCGHLSLCYTKYLTAEFQRNQSQDAWYSRKI